MNRNVESHFSRLPRANIQRSVFDRSSRHLSSGNVGRIIPFYVDSVYPGDTFDITTSKVLRFQTLLTPMMDNMYLDTYWFFVPNRLVWSHWEEFCGENKTGPWAQKVEYSVPTIGCPVDESGALQHFESGTLADYMGLPIGSLWKPTDALAPSALPFRAYSLIINNFFRDENFANPLLVNLDDANVNGSNDAPYGDSQNLSACSLGGKPYLANKYHDYFTSALPSSQKGSPVEIPLSVSGNLSKSSAPVVTSSDLLMPADPAFPVVWRSLSTSADKSVTISPPESVDSPGSVGALPQASTPQRAPFWFTNVAAGGPTSGGNRLMTASPNDGFSSRSVYDGSVPINLVADLDGVSASVSGTD